MKKIYVIKNDKGEELTVLQEGRWCYAAQGKEPINESCGGCVGCLVAQAYHWGYTVEEMYED